MVDRRSMGKDRLGLSFTIDYLLYDKGAKSSREERLEIPQQTVNTHALHHRNRQSKEARVDPDKEEKRPQRSDEKKGQMKVKEDEGGVAQGREGEEVNTASICSISEISKDKPTQSYIALISMAILASEEKKLLLCDIYQWIMDHYPYFRSKDKNWRNSVRHNLSLNECFVKASRSDNGKGHFWAVHPSNYQDFSNGDYHCRRTRRRVRRVRGHVPYVSPGSLYYSVPPHPMETGALPYWCCPPAPGQPLSPCLPSRLYWGWPGGVHVRVGLHPGLRASAP
ncbi:unnamed protein product [Merluccius merluccius]